MGAKPVEVGRELSVTGYSLDIAVENSLEADYATYMPVVCLEIVCSANSFE